MKLLNMIFVLVAMMVVMATTIPVEDPQVKGEGCSMVGEQKCCE